MGNFAKEPLKERSQRVTERIIEEESIERIQIRIEELTDSDEGTYWTLHGEDVLVVIVSGTPVAASTGGGSRSPRIGIAAMPASSSCNSAGHSKKLTLRRRSLPNERHLSFRESGRSTASGRSTKRGKVEPASPPSGMPSFGLTRPATCWRVSFRERSAARRRGSHPRRNASGLRLSGEETHVCYRNCPSNRIRRGELSPPRAFDPKLSTLVAGTSVRSPSSQGLGSERSYGG